MPSETQDISLSLRIPSIMYSCARAWDLLSSSPWIIGPELDLEKKDTVLDRPLHGTVHPLSLSPLHAIPYRALDLLGQLYHGKSAVRLPVKGTGVLVHGAEPVGLRHTCASLMLTEGVPARMIMEVLGHSQISMTMDLYSHIMPALHKEAADRMDAILG